MYHVDNIGYYSYLLHRAFLLRSILLNQIKLNKTRCEIHMIASVRDGLAWNPFLTIHRRAADLADGANLSEIAMLLPNSLRTASRDIYEMINR